MKVTKKPNWFFQGALVVLVIFVVGYVPSISFNTVQTNSYGVVEADDNWPPEIPPSFPYLHNGAGLEPDEELSIVKMGGYDTSWWIPQWITDMIEENTKENNDIAHQEPCRERLTWTIYADGANLAKTETVNEAERHGFFATFSDIDKWEEKMYAYFFFGEIVYVDSIMKKSYDTSVCTEEIFILIGKSKHIKQPSDVEWQARFRFGVSWAPDYQLFERNCQHHTKWVLTGVDDSK